LIQRSGGFVAKYMGDGVLAYFGYPLAHEHDAELAVRAGLAIVDTAPKLETAAGAPLHVRVGIGTGIVVVGDLVGSGESQERGVVGDRPNLAARLQGIAEPDSVVIAESTRNLLGDLFELVDLGPQNLKGVAALTRAWAAVRPSAQESRFDALHAGGLAAMIGRDEKANSCLVAGPRRSRARATSFCSQARPVSASRASRLPFSNAWQVSRTCACAISAHRSTPTARSIRSSAIWSGRPRYRVRTG
jgi:hypothetical protein